MRWNRLLTAWLLAAPLLGVSAASAEVSCKFGFYERVRHEYWKNNWDMENNTPNFTAGRGDRNFFRFKTSVWGQAEYEDLYTLYVKLTNEWKSYTYYGGNAKKGLTGDSDEIIFDSLYLDIKNPGGLPLFLRLGRQDFLNVYGEGFLIADGTPGDGSRTYYFNALKASWEINEKNTLDAVYINQPKTDQYLPVMDPNKPETALSLNDESAYMLYYRNKSVEKLSFEPYYIYKHEGAASGLQAQTGKIHTVGFFAKYSHEPWIFRGQLADQFGDYGPYDRRGLGGYVFVDRAVEAFTFKPVLTCGYVYLSGDDKSTVKNEGWNPLFSRFPAWSEIYAQSYTGESGNSYWTNLQMYRFQALLTLTEKTRLTLIYSFLRANELVPASATYSFSGSGKNRGSLYGAKLDYTFNTHLAGYILGEYFVPGDFYTDDADPAVFVRTQIEIKF